MAGRGGRGGRGGGGGGRGGGERGIEEKVEGEEVEGEEEEEEGEEEGSRKGIKKESDFSVIIMPLLLLHRTVNPIYTLNLESFMYPFFGLLNLTHLIFVIPVHIRLIFRCKKVFWCF